MIDWGDYSLRILCAMVHIAHQQHTFIYIEPKNILQNLLITEP